MLVRRLNVALLWLVEPESFKAKHLVRDVVVATHPHKDHIGGFPLVFESFEVGEVWAPRVDTTSDTYYDFLMAVQQEGLQLRSKTPKRKVSAKLRQDRLVAGAPNEIWAMDLLSDQLFDGTRSPEQL